MDPQPFQIDWSFSNGFYNAPAWAVVPGTYRDSLNLWLKAQNSVSDRGYSTAGTGGGFPLYNCNEQAGGMSGGIGNGLIHLDIPWFAGSGNFLLDGASQGASTGKVMLRIGGVTYAAGLSKPGAAPGLAASAAASSLINGAYAVAYSKYRQTTGAVSSRSPISLAVAARNKKLTVTLPADPGDGTTHYLLYGTRKNFGGSGVVFRITTVAAIPVTAGVQTVDIEYQDGDLGGLAPLANDPSPTCTHVAVLGDVVCAITVGGLIYPSLIGQPEAFDLTKVVRLPNGQAPTGVLHGVDGGVFVSTRSSLVILILTGVPDFPVLPRGVWSNTGFSHGNAFCLAGPELYGMSSSGLPVRTQGSKEPDYSFGEAVAKRMKDDGFTGANAVVVHDEANGCVLYCGPSASLGGSVAWPFMLNNNRWGGPIRIAGTPNAAVAIGGLGKVQVGSQLYSLDSAGGNPSGGWFGQSAHQGANGKIMTIDSYRAQASGAMIHDLLKDLTNTTIGGPFPLNFTPPHGDPAVQKLNDKCDSIALKISGTIGNQQFYEAHIEGTVEPGTH